MGRVDRFLGRLRADAAVHLLTRWAPAETVAARELGRLDRGRRLIEAGTARVGEASPAR
jgi:hypothetical protein